MGISDVIASFLQDSLEEAEDGVLEVQRSDLAQRFNCVPSQINYVLSTRFSPERGYMVESRRGGGGYIRVTRVQQPKDMLLMHTVNAVGEEIDLRTVAAFLDNLRESEIIRPEIARLIHAALSDAALRPVSPACRAAVRASIFKQMLVSLISV